MTTVVYRLAGSISAGGAVAKAKGSWGRARWIGSIAKASYYHTDYFGRTHADYLAERATFRKKGAVYGRYSSTPVAHAFLGGHPGWPNYASDRNFPHVEVDQIDVERHHLLQAVTFEAIGNADSIGFVADRLFESGQVLLMIDHLHVRDGCRTTTHDRAATTKQIPRVSQSSRIDVGGRKRLQTALGRAASQQHGELFGIHAIGFRLSTVDRLEI